MTVTFPQIKPHVGVLINRLLASDARQDAAQRAATLERIILSDLNLADLEMIATGGLSPLTGFMNEDDYESVVTNKRLANGLPWTIPVTLAISTEQGQQIEPGQEVALVEKDDDGERILAILQVTEKYGYDKATEAEHVYRTTEEAHPGVSRLYRQGDVLLAGPI